ncbi:hypothetical protein [Xaviernesmea oryzae]|nr:hypothetical protein [Xaviernesmea oryzae]
MVRLASLLMMLSWMVFSAMPALGMPMASMASRENDGNRIVQVQTPHHHAMPSDVASVARSEQAGAKPDCQERDCAGSPCCAKHCLMAACAACVSVLPESVQIRRIAAPLTAPWPAHLARLVDHRLPPAQPPPRLERNGAASVALHTTTTCI